VSRSERRAAFGAALKRAREKMGLSQRRLAELVSVSPGAVGHWETGRQISEGNVAAVEDALGLERDQLGWILGFGNPPATLTAEDGIAGDTSLSDRDKRVLLATLAEIRKEGQGDG
jgi:transcriptional regulator with XRE-family HTH domain